MVFYIQPTWFGASRVRTEQIETWILWFVILALGALYWFPLCQYKGVQAKPFNGAYKNARERKPKSAAPGRVVLVTLAQSLQTLLARSHSSHLFSCISCWWCLYAVIISERSADDKWKLETVNDQSESKVKAFVEGAGPWRV